MPVAFFRFSGRQEHHIKPSLAEVLNEAQFCGGFMEGLMIGISMIQGIKTVASSSIWISEGAKLLSTALKSHL